MVLYHDEKSKTNDGRVRLGECRENSIVYYETLVRNSCFQARILTLPPRMQPPGRSSHFQWQELMPAFLMRDPDTEFYEILSSPCVSPWASPCPQNTGSPDPRRPRWCVRGVQFALSTFLSNTIFCAFLDLFIHGTKPYKLQMGDMTEGCGFY